MSDPKGSLFFLKSMAKKKVKEYISEWMEEFGAENGYELARTEFVKEGQTWYLRVYVDRLIDGKYDYMTSDDCAVVSQYLSKKLDEEDPIPQNYYLEVSSPGLDRPLLCERDYLRFRGEAIELKLYEPMEDRKQYSGILKDYSDGIMTVELEGGKTLDIPVEKISKVNLAVFF